MRASYRSGPTQSAARPPLAGPCRAVNKARCLTCADRERAHLPNDEVALCAASWPAPFDHPRPLPFQVPEAHTCFALLACDPNPTTTRLSWPVFFCDTLSSRDGWRCAIVCHAICGLSSRPSLGPDALEPPRQTLLRAQLAAGSGVFRLACLVPHMAVSRDRRLGRYVIVVVHCCTPACLLGERLTRD